MIDLFPVDWKMPKEILEMDKMEMVVLGRGVETVSSYYDSITDWLPVWFDNQMLKYKLLIIMGFVAAVGDL